MEEASGGAYSVGGVDQASVHNKASISASGRLLALILALALSTAAGRAASWEATWDPWQMIRLTESVPPPALSNQQSTGGPTASTVTAHFAPVALASSNLVLGKGRELGLWNISVCSNAREALVVPTARVLMAAPRVAWLTTVQAIAVVERKGRRSGRERLIRLLRYAAIGAAVASSSGWAALAVPLIDQAEDQLASGRPNVAALLAELAPESLAIGPGDCKTVTKAASLVRDARAVGPVDVLIP